MEKFDLIVLGGGPAGYNAAQRAAKGGLKTVLIEERSLGGVCLNEGCIPTKTLLYSAKIYDYSKHSAPYGVTFEGAKIDHSAVVTRKNKVVTTLVAGVKSSMKRAGVTVVAGTGRIDGKCDDGYVVRTADMEFAAPKLLICTGSEAVVPPIPGLREGIPTGFVMTNREILDLREVPARLAVIGGGVIGLEMASYFNSVGSEVTVIEMLPQIAGATDADVAKLLKKNYESRGVRFEFGAKVVAVGDGSVTYEKDGGTVSLPCDRVLVSVGRRARTADIGLESVGVATERGAVITDERSRTNVPGIWAAGDVNGRSMLAHTAYREGEVAVNDMLGLKDAVNYRSIPSVIYTNPEVAAVGETEATAKAAGLDVECVTLPLRFSGRYIAENERGDGFVKLVLGREHKNILGVHMIGTYASEIIYGAAMMVDREYRVADVQKFVFPHPTVCEVLREAMFE